MDHGLNGHCLKGLCPGFGRPHKVHLAPMGRYNYPRIHSELETKTRWTAELQATQEQDSPKSQGRGWPRGPTWRLGIS